jgi:hypothetical protein
MDNFMAGLMWGIARARNQNLTRPNNPAAKTGGVFY